MNAFEEIIAGLFRLEGYWTHIGYKVTLTPETKRDLGKSSMPRPEIDILAYRVPENQLLWIECKSYLDSSGVHANSFLLAGDRYASRYKVFTWREFREKVSFELIKQVVKDGLTLPNPTLKYCLVAGRIANETSRTALHEYFEANNWLLYDDDWIMKRLGTAAAMGWEDDVTITVAKLFTAAKKRAAK